MLSFIKILTRILYDIYIFFVKIMFDVLVHLRVLNLRLFKFSYNYGFKFICYHHEFSATKPEISSKKLKRSVILYKRYTKQKKKFFLFLFVCLCDNNWFNCKWKCMQSNFHCVVLNVKCFVTGKKYKKGHNVSIKKTLCSKNMF